jgi:nitrate/TMAO reductase-like tetraheme cytochrome c subunit/mono/diheme cytochrome c family protein
MKRFFKWLKKFFFPSEGTSLGVRLLPYAVLGVLSLVVLVGGAYAWDYTNSPKFCGSVCHTMPPEFSAYEISPHARVRCVECHIGRGFIATQITRKAGDIRHVVFTITRKYEYPITANDMRPARETCERCHFPEKFSDDSLRVIKSYGNDYYSTPKTTYLILKTGGGSKRTGLGKGIHWHIENRILYYPTDRNEQTIPYIRVYNDDGSIDEFIDIEAGIKPTDIQDNDLKEMDCITCHNRITHLVNMPNVSVDIAIDRKIIDPTIPEIRLKGIEVLTATYTSQEQALNGIAGLEDYYRVVYPDYYASNKQTILAAIKALQDIFTQSVYIDQKSDWYSHPDNIGHKNFPGCFRCHDGKHINTQQEPIRLECNLCHSIPKISGEQDFITNIEITSGPEPQTHFNPSWIAIHNKAMDNTCSNCHNTADAGGTSNTSFCSNSACHGTTWKFAGFDAPALSAILAAQLPPTPTPAIPSSGPLTYIDTIGPIFQSRCSSCHGTGGILGLNLTSYQTALAGSENGAVIIPGNPDGSLLVQKQSGPQPHFGQLAPEELKLVIEWILAGAPEK